MRNRKIVFLTRDGCVLCEEVRPRVEGAAELLGIEIDTVDVDSDPELAAEYRLRIPVLLDRCGRVLAEGRISRRQAWRAAWRALR